MIFDLGHMLQNNPKTLNNFYYLCRTTQQL